MNSDRRLALVLDSYSAAGHSDLRATPMERGSTHTLCSRFSVVHIPSIGSLLFLTKEEPEIWHLWGALSSGVVNELWRPFRFGVVPVGAGPTEDTAYSKLSPADMIDVMVVLESMYTVWE